MLILASGNDPLFLPGAQALQALAALLREGRLPDGVFQVLDPATGEDAARAGLDHIVLTGSAETGKRVMAAAATTLTPMTMELSGSDAVFVLPGADLDLGASYTSRPIGRPVSESFLASGRPTNPTHIPVSPMGYRYYLARGLRLNGLLQHDVFAPWLALVPVETSEAALTAVASCSYALGASIFGPPGATQATVGV